jgi:hypothetical protein
VLHGFNFTDTSTHARTHTEAHIVSVPDTTLETSGVCHELVAVDVTYLKILPKHFPRKDY